MATREGRSPKNTPQPLARNGLAVASAFGAGGLPVRRLEVLGFVRDEVAVAVTLEGDLTVRADDPEGLRFHLDGLARPAEELQRRHGSRCDPELAHQRFVHDDRRSVLRFPPLRQPIADRRMEPVQAVFPIVDTLSDVICIERFARYLIEPLRVVASAIMNATATVEPTAHGE